MALIQVQKKSIKNLESNNFLVSNLLQFFSYYNYFFCVFFSQFLYVCKLFVVRLPSAFQTISIG